jgi:molybdopterin synthase catalytic subunit
MTELADVQHPPSEGDTWLGISDAPLPISAAYEWAVRPECGAVVLFSGTARDHSVGRDDVTLLEYEAYEDHVVPRLRSVVDELRVRWPDVVRVAMIHRVGQVPVTESAVVVAVSSPHREPSFLSGRFAIDALKSSVPIWKGETWSDGESWGLEPQHIVEVRNTNP